MKSLLRFFSQTRQAADPPGTTDPGLARADAQELIRLGNEREDAGDYDGARMLYQRAIAAEPSNAEAHFCLGNAHASTGKIASALDGYRRAVELQPDHALAHQNIAALLLGGDPGEAEKRYRIVLDLRPTSAEAWAGLGCALELTSRVDSAKAAFEQALAHEPAHAGAATRLAGLLKSRGEANAALQVLDATIERRPDDVLLISTRAELLSGVADYDAAITDYRRALAIAPNDWAVYSNLLWTLNFHPQLSAHDILAEHRRFGLAIEKTVAPVQLEVRRKDRKRLKVGYVSPDFRQHPIACFIEPILRYHDRERFEVHCFYNHGEQDEITWHLQQLADHWHDVQGIDDDELAQRIASNGIDILVDLAGHSAYNRIGLFARKPAPLQFGWLGYLCTTGLQTIDYRLCDAHTDPTGVAEAWQVETPARLPASQWCYQPLVPVPAATELPRLRNGWWTFGSFNQEAKVNSFTLQLWARLLAAIPQSRLRIFGVVSDRSRERIQMEFQAQGVAGERIDILGRIPIASYLASFGEVDVALDTLPYNGATTTCDALIMGVPTATVEGSRSIARGGVSLLSTVGLREWIAPSPEAFVPMLQALTADPQMLADLRRELPARMRRSPLMDGSGFTRHLEHVFRQAFERVAVGD